MPRNTRVLVLNADYQPISAISWQRAMVLVYQHAENPNEGAEAIEYYEDDRIKSSSGHSYPLPAVIRVVKYIRRKNSAVPFNKKNVYLRDKFTCQYCGKRLPPEKLTYDHVIPRQQWNPKNGTPTKWENIVAACFTCNNKKANRTPKQAGMFLIKEPTKPNRTPQHILGVSPWGYIPEQWKVYLPQIYHEVLT